ncbi:hypothetical protein KTO58_26020 [Chitinophaga pendula]|uniref:hypothetical protein n=1 Tax=Chitinophaga TaxID=79328 RepID=UPI000BB026D3|nr:MULTISPECIES: hypothetical protein [Chitinophaga]ASZ09973.1 hypothetical protein CK934_02750 [Chitinophaga sp. MD30]UCJ07085.1 hypothetical protein KTO58_26020 [Chitinophaga pendula]
MKKLLLLLLVLTAAAASAYASKWEEKKNGEKDKDKNQNQHPKPGKVEEYVWMLPRETQRVDEQELENAIVDLYKWYLQNENKINSNEFLKNSGKEIVFPFKVEAKTLQQYFQFIKKNFPGLSELDLENCKRVLSTNKKYAPVTTRDDAESTLSISNR